MKIGDLVELSACGESIDYNRSLIGKLGIVTEAAEFDVCFVHWLDGQEGFFSTMDLKNVRRNK
jgi:hypothetical protein